MYEIKFDTIQSDGVIDSPVDELIKLNSVLRYEKLYDQVVESYLDFKVNLYKRVLAFSAQNGFYLSDMHIKNYEDNSHLNRLLFNFLNFGKLYVDKFYLPENRFSEKSCYIFDVTGNSCDLELAKKFKESEKEKNLGFFVGIELRNVSQHRDLVINGSVQSVSVKSDEKSVNVSFHIPIYRDELISLLPASKKSLKRRIKLEYGCDMDLHVVLDEFMLGIYNLHNFSRKAIKNNLDVIKESDAVISSKLSSVHHALELIDYLYGKNIEKPDFSNLRYGLYKS